MLMRGWESWLCHVLTVFCPHLGHGERTQPTSQLNPDRCENHSLGCAHAEYSGNASCPWRRSRGVSTGMLLTLCSSSSKEPEKRGTVKRPRLELVEGAGSPSSTASGRASASCVGWPRSQLGTSSPSSWLGKCLLLPSQGRAACETPKFSDRGRSLLPYAFILHLPVENHLQ